MTPDEVFEQCTEANIRLVRFLYCDTAGIVRGKSSHVRGLVDRMQSGIGLSADMPALNSLDELQVVPGLDSHDELRLLPDPATLTILPYAPHTAAMLCDLIGSDGQLHGSGARGFLRRIAGQLEDQRLSMKCSIETEFALAKYTSGAFVPIDESLDLSTAGMDAAAVVVDRIIDALDRQGLQVELYYPEVGHGQHELSIAPRNALAAADDHILVRETIRSVATGCGLVASLGPKPWPEQPGNGTHLHLSLWDADGTRNLFYDPSNRYGISQTAEYFTAGILAHLPALLSITAPSILSYRRLVPDQWSSAFVCWGSDNREASIRIPPKTPGWAEASTNLEYRPIDGSCNPYLAIGAIIVAGLDGIASRLSPPDPIEVNPTKLDLATRTQRAITPYPGDLAAALLALDADDTLSTAIGPILASAHIAVRRSEWEEFSSMDEDSVFRSQFGKY